MNQLIFLAIAIFGVLLITQKQLLQQNIPSQVNSYIGFMYDNNTIVGAILIVGAYYMYTQEIKSSVLIYNQGTSDFASSF